MHDLLKDLNTEQKKAVTAPMGPVLVLAGAGSGKTRVLTYRIAYLLKEKIFKPENLLALTFTNKAAGEMKERIARITNHESRITGKSGRDTKYEIRDTPMMGTFHSVCARFLRRDFDPNFVIYDSDDSLRVIKQIVLEKGLDKVRPQVFAYYISAAKNKLVEPKDLNLENDFFMENLQSVYEAYKATLAENNALDFDDLLAVTFDLLSGDKALLKKYQERFRYILVDEYQDTNHVQYMLLKLLVGKNRNIFVVGDDAQSIYGFRGANMQNILNFKKDYPRAKIIFLEQNYRSSQKILDVAHKVIRLNPKQYEKKLWTENAGGEKVSLYEALDEMDEAEFVVRRITNHESRITEEEPVYVNEETPILDRFLKSQKRNYFRPVIRNTEYVIPDNLNETVVLYRTHAQSRPLEEALLISGIPYQIIGGIKFYERREIKDVIAYLRLLINPRDLVSMSRVVNIPARGIGAVSFKQLTGALKKYAFDFERLLLNLEQAELSPAAQGGARIFFETLRAGAGLSAKESLPNLMHLVLKQSGYKESILDGTSEGETRWENIEELFNVAARFAHLPWREGLLAFLQEIALMTDLDSVDDDQNKLTLMTLHSAKGLEFERVFFVGLEEGLLPHSRSLLSAEELAEEIRLAYVGITRAKKYLYLSYARQRQVYGELKRCAPSRILKAVPKSLLNRITY